MGCGTGDKQEIEFAIPEDQKLIRSLMSGKIEQGLRAMMGANAGKGTPGYGGPIAVSQNPLNLAAANMMMNYMGYGNYKTPSYLNYNQLMGGTSPGPTPNPPTPPTPNPPTPPDPKPPHRFFSSNPMGSTSENGTSDMMQAMANNPLFLARMSGYNPYQSR
jgi:hypothetical protein